ncbi:MAG: hypothetical protein ACHQX3_10355, partial [Nitrospirales bacterium]
MEDFEQPPRVNLVTMRSARTKERMMPVRQPAIGIVSNEFIDQPLLLRCAPTTGFGITVKRKDM